MNFNFSLALTAFIALSFTAVGCATVSPNTAQTPAPASTLVIEVPNAPPPAKDEAKPANGEVGHIWVAGYWDYLDGHHVWREGRWVQGKIGYEYVRARYEFDGKAWQFHVPHWHRRPTNEPTTVAQAHR